MGPHTILKSPADLEKVCGKPTGQGYGAARRGPDVKGTPHEEVVNSNYDKGQSFTLDLTFIAICLSPISHVC